MYFEEGPLTGKRKCQECGCPVFELVSNKEPAKVNVVCFHCGEILEPCSKDEINDDKRSVNKQDV